jgi:ATP-binding cassette, subfamily B, multidrug efflux pump
MGFLWELRPYFRQVAGLLVIGSLGGIIMNTTVVLPAILLGVAIDRAYALERGEAEPRDVALAALAFVAVTLFTELPRIGKRWWLQSANARIRASLRVNAFRGVLTRPMADLHKTSIGDLMARIVGDVEVLGVGLREFTIEIWDTVLFSISFIVAMIVIDQGLTAIVLAPVPVAMIIAHASGRWVIGRTVRAREANSALTTRIQEFLSGFRVLRLFGRNSAATQEVADLSGEFAARNLGVTRLRMGLRPAYSTLMTAGVIFIVWQGGARVIGGSMTLGEFVAYLQLFMRFVDRGHRIPQLVNSIQSGAAAYGRLRPLLAPACSVEREPPFASFRTGHLMGDQPPVERVRERLSGPAAVALQGVTFRYPGAREPALTDLSLEIPAGAIVGVTGPVGAGKSALARALLGIYPLETGSVAVGGRPGNDLAQEDRRGLIGYLPQDARVFSGTVLSNILLSSSAAPTESSERAIRAAALDDDVAVFPDGVDTEIGELGVRVSGGQRQRVGLARALAAADGALPALLVLDDPFSAIDVETEARIIESLRGAFGSGGPHAETVTIVLCSQRLASFPLVDLVVVLERGRITELGTHAELISRDGLYAHIYRAQDRAPSIRMVAGLT